MSPMSCCAKCGGTSYGLCGNRKRIRERHRRYGNPQKTNTDLIQTLDDVLKIQKEGRLKRREAEAEMARMENDLKINCWKSSTDRN